MQGVSSQARVLDCSCPLAKSADILCTHASSNPLARSSRPFGMPHCWQPIPLFFPPLPLSDLSIATIPFHRLTSPQICSERITGTRCRAALKPNPQNGSGKVSGVGGWRRSPRFVEGLGPPEILAPALIKQMGTCFDLCRPVLWSPAASGVLLVFSTMALSCLTTVL